MENQYFSSEKSLCLACAVYSLGLLGADWDSLPHETRESLISLSEGGISMKDQTLSNILYGLGLLKVQWYGNILIITYNSFSS